MVMIFYQKFFLDEAYLKNFHTKLSYIKSQEKLILNSNFFWSQH